MTDRRPDAIGWELSAEQAILEQEPLRAKRLLYGIASVVILLVAWAYVAEVDTVTRGQGKVIPSRQVQLLGSQDGGVITDIMVREGDLVAKGQLLVKLDPTRSNSSLGENRAQLVGLQVKAARLSALAEGALFQPTAEMTSVAPDVVKEEQRLYQSNLAELSVQQRIADSN